MKEDADQWRKWRQQKDKEVLQLQQKVVALSKVDLGAPSKMWQA